MERLAEQSSCSTIDPDAQRSSHTTHYYLQWNRDKRQDSHHARTFEPRYSLISLLNDVVPSANKINERTRPLLGHRESRSNSLHSYNKSGRAQELYQRESARFSISLPFIITRGFLRSFYVQKSNRILLYSCSSIIYIYNFSFLTSFQVATANTLIFASFTTDSILKLY